MSNSWTRLEISPRLRGALMLAALTMSLLTSILQGVIHAQPVHAAGTRNLWANGQLGNRALTEWRTSSYGGGVVRRRTLIGVFMNAGEVMDLGSSAVGLAGADIFVWDPGLITGPRGNEVIPAVPSYQCSTQRTASGVAAQGKITSRAMELAGPDTIPTGGVGGGYYPCYHTAASSGLYNIAFLPTGGLLNDNNSTVPGDVALADPRNFDGSQAGGVEAWDVTVRTAVTSPVDITGRTFSYALAMYTTGNGLPVYPAIYAVTNDGYRYQIDLRGMDPNGWVSYGNQVGFLDPDGVTPLYHDAVAANLGAPGQLTSIQGGVIFAPPSFPMFFEPPSNAALIGLGLPVAPTAPVISAVSFSGNQGANTTTVSTGGTFSYTSNVAGVYDITISQDGVNWDPTLPTNARLRGVKPSGAQTVTWNGRDNSANPFPVGTYSFRASVHGGEYHFPFIDVENSVSGGPTITLLNPPGGVCPSWTGGCRGAFYDDRAYSTTTGVVVNSGNVVGTVLCGNLPPTIPNSDPLLGFDTSGGQRGFGAASGGNTNVPCTGNFGDAKGLDIWTYTPSSNATSTVNIISPRADIALTKTVDVTYPAVGSNVTFTVTATNNGPNDATGITVNDLLPAGLTYVSSTPSGSTTYNPGTGDWSIGALAKSASATLAIVATVRNSNNVTNTATKSTQVEIDPVPANNTASVTINPHADIVISKIVSNPTPDLGSNVTFTITAQNTGPAPATGLAVTDLLPAGLTYVSSTPSVGTYNAGTGVWAIGNLANAASVTLALVATVTTTTPVSNTATKTAEAEVDVTPADDAASATVTGRAADIAITNVVSNPTPGLGSNVTFTITAGNGGPNNATGVAVTNTLSAGLTYVSSVPSVGTYNAGTGVWTLGPLANATSATLTVTATVTSSAAQTLTAARTASSPTDPNPANDSATATTTGQAADLAVTEVVSNPTPNFGSNTVFTTTVTNNGPNNATGVTATITIPPGLAYVSNTPSGSTTYNSGSGVWTIGNLANGASATLALTVTDNSTATLTVSASRTSSNPVDPNAANDTATASATGQPAADIAVTQTSNTLTPNYGSNFILTVTATNNGPTAATGVQVTDLLPPGLTYVSSATAAGTYTSGTGVWNIGNLALGQTVTLTITGTDNSTLAKTVTATRTASSPPDLNAANDSQSVTLAGQASDIGVSMLVSNAAPNLGSNITFTVTARNNGPSDTTGVQLTDLLPAGLTYVSNTPGQGTFNPGTGLWNIGSLVTGASVTLTLVATAVTTSPVTNTATRTAGNQPDLNPANDSASQTVQAVAADIAVSMAVTNNTPNLGTNVTFTVTAQNLGPNNATGVVITDLLPAGLTYVSSTPSIGSYTSGTGNWAIGNLANAGTATLDIVATSVATTPVTNTATRTASNPVDNNAANDSAAQRVTGQSADVQIGVTVSTPTPNYGTNVTFFVTATNNGPSDATGVLVGAPLPAGLTFVSANPAQGTYDSGTGVWTVGGIPSGSAPLLRIVATVSTTTPKTLTVTKTAEVQPDPVPANDSASVTVTPQSADIALTKIVDNANPALGTKVTFTVTATNNGPGAATGVVVNDLLPVGLTYVSSTASGTTTYNPLTGDWTIGAVANGASATLKVSATVTGVGTKTNTATRTASNPPDPTPGNDSASVSVTSISADIAVLQTVSSTTPSLSSNVTFTVTAQNLGPNNATGVTIIDLIPPGLNYVSSSTLTGTYTSGSGAWAIGNLANGATATLTVVAATASTSTLTVTATRTASTPVDPNAANDASSVRVTGQQAADLAITKVVDQPRPYLGTQVTYTMTVHDLGPSDATGLQLTDRLPAGLSFISASTTQGSYDPGTGNWKVGTLANGQTAGLYIRALIQTTAPVLNIVTVTAVDQPSLSGYGIVASASATASQIPGLPDDGNPPSDSSGAGSLALLGLLLPMFLGAMLIRRRMDTPSRAALFLSNPTELPISNPSRLLAAATLRKLVRAWGDWARSVEGQNESLQQSMNNQIEDE